MKSRLLLASLALIILFTSGCATSAVLNSGPKQFRPSASPNLAMLQKKDGQRLLVLYDEASEAYRKPVRRAYWIDPQAEPPSRVELPLFVEPWRAKGLQPILIADDPASSGYSAVPEKDNPTVFTLYYDGEKRWRYKLPVYEKPRFTLTQSAVLPLAVAADLTIVGGVLFVYAMGSTGGSGMF